MRCVSKFALHLIEMIKQVNLISRKPDESSETIKNNYDFSVLWRDSNATIVLLTQQMNARSAFRG